MDRLLPNSKDFYIDLDENKYYFPGDLIKGTVILNLEKTTKTNHISITLTGQVNTEKASKSHGDSNSSSQPSNSLKLLSLPSIKVAKSSNGKAHWLEAQSHRFPFEFQLPNTEPLPSSLKLKKKHKSKCAVRYQIIAVHERPLVPAPLARRTKKELRVLERLDITQPEYSARSMVIKTVGEPGKNSKASMTLPRNAVVRGDILPLEIKLDHHREFAREKGIKIELIRRIYYGRKLFRRNLAEQKSIKSFTLDIKIPENTRQQTIDTKLSIPTHTPPTVSSESGRILSVEYAIQAVVNLNDPLFSVGPLTTYRFKPSLQLTLESNLIIGTYPRPNVSIDDDSEEGSSEDDDDDDSTLLDDDDQSTRPSLTSSDSTSTTTSAHIVEPDRRSSASVIDPTTMKNMTIDSSPRQRHSFTARSSPSSITLVEPSPQLRHVPSPMKPTTVIDPTLRHHTSPQTKPLPQRSGSVTTIEPPPQRSGSVITIEPLMKPARRSPPPRYSLPQPMASMPDISAYVPPKGHHSPQNKRPPLHIHHPPTYPHQQHGYPPSSPGGFIVPPQNNTHYPTTPWS